LQQGGFVVSDQVHRLDDREDAAAPGRDAPELRLAEASRPGLPEGGPAAGQAVLVRAEGGDDFARCARWARVSGGEALIILSRHREASPEEGGLELVLDEAGDAEAIRSVIRRVHGALNARPETPRLARERRLLASLTDRELEVLRLTAEGLSVIEIGERLHRSVNTVSTHRRNLHRKLGLDDRVALARFAIRHGLATAD
jgi:DNA-binding CsgD family transcriptional regulator